MVQLLAALLLAAAEDPAGTVPLEVEAGKTAPVKAPSGSHILCDDLSVATPEFTPDGEGYVIRGVAPGSTLCGVWVAEQVPGGLYRVTVKAAVKEAPKPAKEAPKKDGGA